MKKNVSSQSIGAEMITAADGTAFTGSVSVLVTKDNGTQTAGGATAPAHEGNGYHSYSPTQAETNADHIAFTFTGAGAIPATVQLFTSFPQTTDHTAAIADVPTNTEFNARTLTSATYATAANLTTVDNVVDAIKVTTDKFVFTVANQVDSNMLTHTAAIPTNYITAAGITAGAMNGKGDWNLGKAGYSLTVQDWNTVVPDNTSIAAILVDTNDLQTNQGDWLTATGFSTFNSATDGVIVTTNNDKTGYSLTQSFPANFSDLAIAISTGIVSADIKKINNTTIIGDGSSVPFDT